MLSSPRLHPRALFQLKQFYDSMVSVPLDELSAQANLSELFITIRQQQSSREKEVLNLLGEHQGSCGQEHGRS